MCLHLVVCVHVCVCVRVYARTIFMMKIQFGTQNTPAKAVCRSFGFTWFAVDFTRLFLLVRFCVLFVCHFCRKPLRFEVLSLMDFSLYPNDQLSYFIQPKIKCILCVFFSFLHLNLSGPDTLKHALHSMATIFSFSSYFYFFFLRQNNNSTIRRYSRESANQHDERTKRIRVC